MSYSTLAITTVRALVNHEPAKHIDVYASFSAALCVRYSDSTSACVFELRLADVFTKAQTIAQHDFSVIDPP